MQAAYDLYGIGTETLDDAKELISSLLAIAFVQRDSSYIGIYFHATGQGAETFKLRENLDPMDSDPAEPDFADHRFLLYVDGSVRGQQIRSEMEGHPRVILLRHEAL